jgi:signal transduction histidine kinase/ligand-binding sensor domain-containing protein
MRVRRRAWFSERYTEGRSVDLRPWTAALLVFTCAPGAFALDPHKSLTQYSRKVWTQQHGLPQDTIRAIAQTADGYLWLGTDEGLARFDGYDFTIFNKANRDLPSNSITALAAAPGGTLWIGTTDGLTEFSGGRFRTYTRQQGLPDDAVSSLLVDHTGALWIVAGIELSRFEHGKFTNYAPGPAMPVTSFRAVAEDGRHNLWVAGFSAVGKLADGKFEAVLGAAALDSEIVNGLAVDPQGNLWIGGSKGAIMLSPGGQVRKFSEGVGLPDPFLRAIWVDRDGSVWAGTNAGLARLEDERFVTAPVGSDRGDDQVRCLYEDREGDLWVGSNNGLTQLRDDVFTVYGKSEGFPSDEPNVAYQDRAGRIWVGFHDAGLLMISDQGRKLYTTRDGLPNNEVFSIRETRDGDLLIGTRGGLLRLHDGRFTRFVPNDPLSRILIFDALEDSAGRVWLAGGFGLGQLRGQQLRNVISGPPLLKESVVTLCEGSGGVMWAGTYGKGLWRIDGESLKLYTTADGLSSDQIRSLYQDADGTLWIATSGGGLDAFRDGRFSQFTEKDGLLSDNIAKVEDDGESLWLATTRGICRIFKQQLKDFAQGRSKMLEPLTYGVEDGLRSAQCSPAFPVGGGGNRMADGRLWFTTSRGLAVFDAKAKKRTRYTPAAHLAEMTADGRPVDLTSRAKLQPGSLRIEFHYTAIHLSAPELVRYSYKLDGLDQDWVKAGGRRVKDYNSLRHGQYLFHVRADLPGGPGSEESYAFTMLPRFYETAWFLAACGAMLLASGWAAYQMRLGQIRSRFAAVLEERARLAREIHDTLAQGFVGISSQLDAVAMCMPDESRPARKYLDMARRMARHSLTEARRSVMDLRASVLEGQDLAAALESGMRIWTAGSGMDVKVEVSGPQPPLPEEMEQNLLRIAQEAVTNIVKHAGATNVWIKLHTEAKRLYLRVADNGRGFEQGGAFSSQDGHFGLIGMRERAERLGGELTLASHPGEGTQVEVMAPLP